MDRSEYHEYLKSPEWQGVRSRRLRIDGFRCVNCGATRRLQVHHINYAHVGAEDVHNDLVTLCDVCHKRLEKAPTYVVHHNIGDYRQELDAITERIRREESGGNSEAVLLPLWERVAAITREARQ